MDIDQTKKCIEVMQAFVDGKDILHNRCELVTDPVWDWGNSPDRYKIDPYSELRRAEKDPNKQIRYLGGQWFDAGQGGWDWCGNPGDYEIRDKPRTRKVKLTAWLVDNDSLVWTAEGSSSMWLAETTLHRVPSEDKEVEVEE